MKKAFLFFMVTMAGLAQQVASDPHQFGVSSEQLAGIERLEFVAGYGEKTDNFRVSTHWHLFSRTRKHFDADFSLGANYSVFDGEEDTNGETPQMRDVGLTPTATLWFRKEWMGFEPFVEMGIGLHYLSGKHFTTKDFSTRFQFGDHIGVGVRFGRERHLRLTYQFQHLSNAGIDDPNPGINFHLVNLGVKLK